MCRRKKSKCPGEKPACSFCSRLGQTCYYADESVHSYVGQPTNGSQPAPPYDQLRKTAGYAKTLEEFCTNIVLGGKVTIFGIATRRSPWIREVRALKTMNFPIR